MPGLKVQKLNTYYLWNTKSHHWTPHDTVNTDLESHVGVLEWSGVALGHGWLDGDRCRVFIPGYSTGHRGVGPASLSPHAPKLRNSGVIFVSPPSGLYKHRLSPASGLSPGAPRVERVTLALIGIRWSLLAGSTVDFQRIFSIGSGGRMKCVLVWL